MIAVVVEVDEEGAPAKVEDIQTGLSRCVAGGSIALMEKETVGKSSGLKNIDVVQLVSIDVADDHTLGSQEICNQALVRAGPPVVKAARQLFAVARRICKNGGRGIDEFDASRLPRSGLTIVAHPQ